MIKNRQELFSLHWTCASLAGLAFLAGCASTPSTTQKTTGWIKDEVADSYVFGYPLVLMGVATTLIGLLPTYASVGLWAPVSESFLIDDEVRIRTIVARFGFPRRR